jgi:hypothetical protein
MFEEGADTHYDHIYIEAKIRRKMALNGKNTSPGEFGTALRSIFKMLCIEVPSPQGRPILKPVGIFFFNLSWPRCMVCVCTLFQLTQVSVGCWTTTMARHYNAMRCSNTTKTAMPHRHDNNTGQRQCDVIATLLLKCQTDSLCIRTTRWTPTCAEFRSK